MTRKLLVACLMVAVMLASSGCINYYIVRSELVEQSQIVPSPEVTDTPVYREQLPQIQRVALSAPDSCASETAAQTSGQASAAGTILQTACGVEMSELERALTQAGYVVSSWSAIKNMVIHNGLTPLAAAQSLGAQVLFQVNSLEKSVIRPPQNAQFQRTPFASDEAGNRGGPVAIDAQTVAQIEPVIAPSERQLLQGSLLSATINATAMLIDNGQAIWFYQWTQVEQPTEPPAVENYLYCEDGGACWLQGQTQSRAPMGGIQNITPGVNMGNLGAMQQGYTLTGRPADQEDAIYYELMKGLIRDLVSRFAGQSGPPQAPVMTTPAPASQEPTVPSFGATP